ncbi:MAG: GxxExxY protein [Chitinophagales bacterium]|nr:GxxExxY protein [Chitinophagales bacterium]
MKHAELTSRIIQVFYQVYNELGYGFLEKVYQNALFYALQQEGIKVEAHRKILVRFRGVIVGEYISDIVADSTVIIEVKAAESLTAAHEFQLINYLKCSEMEVGLLLNFGKSPEFKRKIFEKGVRTSSVAEGS